MLLEEGRHGKHQVVDPAWISRMTAPGQTIRPDFGLLCRRWLDPESGELLGIYHDGWLGQYLLVCPRSRSVIVRLISRASSVQAEASGFDDFLDLACHVARA